ncbi:alpha/beta hydrolase [Treponema primitia]|uniref:alpha/beta hydrolase n=1 Tax=Treponema primitia TaxID=88058 RepID=UPI000255531E|nr:alpha/beta hydrolase [Treponema primitia]
MSLKEVSFPSYNGRDTVKGWVYTSIRKPKGIVQVVHGLGEHSRRYLHFILKLNEAGFVVCADDHVGHGKTAIDSDTLGDYGDKGYITTTEDEKSLHDLVIKDYPGLPYIVFGHSWGSMIARSFAAQYGKLLSGLVLCGTCGVLDAFESVQKELKALIDAGKGSERDPRYLGVMFAGWTDRYEDAKTPSDWVSADPDIVADQVNDPFSNNFSKYPPTNQANYDLVALVEAITGPQWAAKVPKDLPIYNIAGDLDPVGNYGEGVYAVTNWLANTGHRRVATKLYPGHRHEINNDRDIREEVTDGVISFINSIL